MEFMNWPCARQSRGCKKSLQPQTRDAAWAKAGGSLRASSRHTKKLLILIANESTQRLIVLTRAIAYVLMNVYAIKMAAVFMLSTSTVTLFTGLTPRWIALLGLGLAAIILFGWPKHHLEYFYFTGLGVSHQHVYSDRYSLASG